MIQTPFNVDVRCEEEFCTEKTISLFFTVEVAHEFEELYIMYKNIEGEALYSNSEHKPLCTHTMYSIDSENFESVGYSEPDPELDFVLDCEKLAGEKLKTLFTFINEQEEKVEIMLTIEGSKVKQEFVDTDQVVS